MPDLFRTERGRRYSLRNGAVSVNHDGRGADRCEHSLLLPFLLRCFLAAPLPQKRRGSQGGAQLQMLQSSHRGVAMPNARNQHAEAFASGEEWEGYYARNLVIEGRPSRGGTRLDSRYATTFQRLQPNCT